MLLTHKDYSERNNTAKKTLHDIFRQLSKVITIHSPGPHAVDVGARVEVLQPGLVALADLAQQVDPFLLLDAVGRLDVEGPFFPHNLDKNETKTNRLDMLIPCVRPS